MMIIVFNMSMKQLTLAILKPDVQRFINYRKYVESLMSDAQLQIIHNEEVFMTRDRAQVFYAEHKGKFFYDRLVNHMICGPLGVYILAGNNAISVWRSLLGPTKVYRCQPTCTVLGPTNLVSTSLDELTRLKTKYFSRTTKGHQCFGNSFSRFLSLFQYHDKHIFLQLQMKSILCVFSSYFINF
ncbi:unnamed protein product [Schistosoma mattheei]|uniref:Nucleoside diphosphate kinase-like domain-containing protein n=1 Tax=Schistosoma mattheei TaxID=31246 RepID=A0AA85C242_9TREM|nr:unnamed protein product [Schistosoma mattheei]